MLFRSNVQFRTSFHKNLPKFLLLYFIILLIKILSHEKTTLKELSETLGKETIDLYNTSETRSNQKSFGLNYQKTGKELMSQDEITVMDGGKCIFQLRGVRPFLSDKFDITKHKNYKFLEDYDKKNVF